MLRKDTNAGFYTPKGGCLSQSKGDTKVFNTGGRDAWEIPFTKSEYDETLLAQSYKPIAVCRAEGKVWWLFQGEIYWNDDGHDGDTIHALLLERQEKEQRKIDKLKRQHGI